LEFIATHWRLAAVAMLFFAGIALRRLGAGGDALGRRLLAFVFNVGLPILVFGALTGVPLAREHALLPVAAVCTALVGWGAAAWVARRFALPRKGEGALALCAMSLNVSMIYPFASLAFVPAAFAQLVMFDMGHAVFVWLVTTVVACRYGGHADDIPVLLRRVLFTPALWVLGLALALNAGGVPVPKDWLRGILFVGQILVLLVPLAMGLLVSARGMRRPEVWTAVALRSGLGFAVGAGLATVFGFAGITWAVAAIGAAAPIGFTAVVLSAREELDLELAASAGAISVFFGSLWIPVAVALAAAPI
jgi:predicted permease